MEKKEFKYDAFISYRHCELDKFVAENLHKILERYELPRNVKKKLGIVGKPFKRVFRDQEELPLTSNLEDPIIDALKDSKYLIVICSPRLKDSLWCKKEIETFKKLRGRRNIFCVLIEGEPKDSFPEEVLYDDDEKKLVEPLAADVRGTTNAEVLKKIHEEKLRLIAPMYQLDYDDLKQRHKIWRQKRIIKIAFGVALFSLLFAVYSLMMFIKIQTQQNVLAEHQALSLASKAQEYMSQDDRYDAIKSSYEALTNFEEVDMPYTPEAEYALSESLGVYDAGYTYKTVSEIQTDGVATFVKTGAESIYGAVYDESEVITLFNTINMKKIKSYPVQENTEEAAFSFIGRDLLAFINKDGNINIVNNADGKIIKEIKKEEDKILSVKGEREGTYLTYVTKSKAYIYNIKEDKLIGTVKNTTNDSFIEHISFSHDSQHVLLFSNKINFDLTKEDSIILHVINVKDAKEINNHTFNASYIKELETEGNKVYLLFNKTKLVDQNILLVSYDYVNGTVEWSKTFEKLWGSNLVTSAYEGSNTLAIASNSTVMVLNATNGNVIENFGTKSDVIELYSFVNQDVYLVFLKDGHVNYVNMQSKSSVDILGKYQLNLDSYKNLTLAYEGFLMIPENDNRVILYQEKANRKMKEENYEGDLAISEALSPSEVDKIKEEYKLKNKSLVDSVIYDTKKDFMFVNYTNGDIAIYNVKSKELINTLKKVGKINHYFGKDKYGRIYVGTMSEAFIISDKYELVGHIASLSKVEKDKVIVEANSKYYSIKIYNLNDLLKEAKEYLRID